MGRAMTPAAPDPLEVFEARCAARAYLWSEAELDLDAAVDELQSTAEHTGLIARLGQDDVYARIAAPFIAVSELYDPEPPALVPAPEAAEHKRRWLPRSTLRAAEYLIEQGDPDRLRRWLNGRTA